MRLIKYFVANSLDNFISRKDGSVDWLFMDQDYGMSEFFSTVDVAVMGRKTYEKMLELSPEKPFFPAMKHYVFSRTIHFSLHKQVEFVSGDVASWGARVRSQPGKDIWLVGGGDFVRSFLQNKWSMSWGWQFTLDSWATAFPCSQNPIRRPHWSCFVSSTIPTASFRFSIASSSLTSRYSGCRLPNNPPSSTSSFKRRS